MAVLAKRRPERDPLRVASSYRGTRNGKRSFRNAALAETAKRKQEAEQTLKRNDRNAETVKRKAAETEGKTIRSFEKAAALHAAEAGSGVGIGTETGTGGDRDKGGGSEKGGPTQKSLQSLLSDLCSDPPFLMPLWDGKRVWWPICTITLVLRLRSRAGLTWTF